jgi:hypothetical protein
MAVMRALALLAALGIPAVSADAQSVTVGGAVHDNLQRFDGDASLNRLDGDALGWMILGGARLGPWAARGEASHDSTIRNAQSIMLTVRGGPATIHSELSHDMREIAAFGGYAHDFAKGIEVIGLGGVSFVTVHRAFTSDAADQVLIPPSTIPTAAVTTTIVDRFAVWTTEADVSIRLMPHLKAIGGVRFQPISLSDDLSGKSFRTLAGLVWQFK